MVDDEVRCMHHAQISTLENDEMYKDRMLSDRRLEDWGSPASIFRVQNKATHPESI